MQTLMERLLVMPYIAMALGQQALVSYFVGNLLQVRGHLGTVIYFQVPKTQN